MRRPALLLATALTLPGLALAQTTVPAIDASASATATASASASASQPSAGGTQQLPPLPPGMPPAVHLLRPSAPLSAKEKRAAGLARKWAAASHMPHPGPDGVVRFPYGATLASVVCSPLHTCDLALKPGEIVNFINGGDKIEWDIKPALSGSPQGPVTHLVIKPFDAGLQTNVTIYTNERTYSVALVSTQATWVPFTGFTYTDDTDNAWAAYQQTVGVPAAYGAGGAFAGSGAAAGAGGSVVFYSIQCSGSPTWVPLHAWTDGAKTYVEFAPGVLSSGSPALVGLAGGGFFSGPMHTVVPWRLIGNRYVADIVLARAALVAGVGGQERQCLLERGAAR